MKLNALQVELAKIERRRAQLQHRISQQAKSLYASLPAKVGLRTVDALIMALAPYASPFVRGKLNPRKAATQRPRVTRAKSAVSAPAKSGKRPRVRPAVQKNAVREAFKEGKLTTRAISTRYGVPYNTLKKWKKGWGLTSAGRGKKT